MASLPDFPIFHTDVDLTSLVIHWQIKTDLKNVTFPEISDSDSDDEYQIESIRFWHPNKHNIKAIKSPR